MHEKVLSSDQPNRSPLASFLAILIHGIRTISSLLLPLDGSCSKFSTVYDSDNNRHLFCTWGTEYSWTNYDNSLGPMLARYQDPEDWVGCARRQLAPLSFANTCVDV